MSGWEEELPPIARERLAKIGAITPEERERIKASQQLDSVLSEFHKGVLGPDDLREELKVYKDEGKVSLLEAAQVKLIESLRLESTAAELQERKAGILAIETLKDHPNTSMLEQSFNSIDTLQARYKKEIQERYDHLKAQIERNPQSRMQQVKQGQRTVAMQLSVDEAIMINPEWGNFLATHERNYRQEFAKVVGSLKEQVGEPAAEDVFRQDQKTSDAQRQDIRYELTITEAEALQGTQKSLIRKGKRLVVEIPPGVKTGSIVKLSDARQITDGEPGDIVVQINLK